MFTQRISGFSDSRFFYCHLVENEDVITPREITLLQYNYISLEPNRESDAGKTVVISRTSVSRLVEERKLIQNEVN